MSTTAPTAPSDRATPHLRTVAPDDGAAIHRFVADEGGLDLNSAYAYVLGARFFAATSVVAEGDDGLAGFILGVAPPAEPTTVFVWQVAVAAAARGQGLGARMLRWLVDEVRPTHLEATVTPTNTASQRLFHGLARDLGAPIEVTRWAESSDLDGAEPEDLHRIGPIPGAR